ncbi:hydroxysqualene dehydroxylase HpnE [Magnetovibrio sp.]|uniref:hydroxysqualene dehydroxylase HpnE n=1 Tax=Magnetovibrio sp. TaxID=2024836 RepID=UPI002F926475
MELASGRVHVIGAGLAGLSAAVRLSRAGLNVSVHETAKHAGGRCRSFFDDALDATIDNGTHLLLSGNREVLDYADLIGGAGELHHAPRAAFEFKDLEAKDSWCVDLGASGGLSLIRWLWDTRRHPPGLKPAGFLSDVWALRGGRDKSVAACIDSSSHLARNFWRPLCLAVLNGEPTESSAYLLWAMLRRSVLKGGAFAKPVFAPDGLGAALVDPALAVLSGLGAEVHFQRRITKLDIEGAHVGSIRFANAAEVLSENDAVILAVPHQNVAELIEGVDAPPGSNAILNVHYRIAQTVDEPRMLGIVGGETEWLFQRADIVSVTISAANAWMDKDTDAIAHTLWPEVAQALDINGDALAYRVIKERRATFAATPEALALRPATRTHLKNLYLAGDWTDTGLPATLESAAMSGRLAAEAVMRDMAR